ncbi:uncharacterized protein ACLA_098830 [Aspergillus clavatus NRRL 1]|uniref:Uncharacterized protein n=1 Tax=Aspergillus clavatus (strain ATCC 1007 / CBS 513.65 / DSM 816 / NCTC 3887 / NRRL 1 / QM 1276 / 107) TaxID=344612 RepID=A1CN04_ASPCL|nr:uncharacterized protein ACLA_098830 [Aspergillus clavatus NRRL 1]EAW08941.1 hypothetical protein ACLA_098830 [Aspergillus clavatus NRRL 1]
MTKTKLESHIASAILDPTPPQAKSRDKAVEPEAKEDSSPRPFVEDDMSFSGSTLAKERQEALMDLPTEVLIDLRIINQLIEKLDGKKLMKAVVNLLSLEENTSGVHCVAPDEGDSAHKEATEHRLLTQYLLESGIAAGDLPRMRADDSLHNNLIRLQRRYPTNHPAILRSVLRRVTTTQVLGVLRTQIWRLSSQGRAKTGDDATAGQNTPKRGPKSGWSAKENEVVAAYQPPVQW